MQVQRPVCEEIRGDSVIAKVSKERGFVKEIVTHTPRTLWNHWEMTRECLAPWDVVGAEGWLNSSLFVSLRLCFQM